MGAEENIELANKMVEQGAKTGSWVIIKNIHISISWLSSFERLWSNQKVHKNCRVFLISEFTEKIPNRIIQNSFKIVYEFSEGILNSMNRIFKGIS